MWASVWAVPSVPLVQAKTTIPSLPRRLVARERLHDELTRLIGDHRLVEVLGAAGAGKTTAVVDAVRELERPVAWLTLDDTDAAPGRLVLYLEAAMRRAVPSLHEVATEALSSGLRPAEGAAVVADRLAGQPFVLVVDEVERLARAPEALAVLAAFVRYLPGGATVVLLGRRAVELDIGSRVAPDEVVRLDPRRLDFTEEEAARALALRGLDDVDPAAVVDATGGWVAAVLFDRWADAEAAAGSGNDVDPLAGYLAHHIVDELEDDERELLVVTSLLEHVDAASATALGYDEAATTLASLRERHLPVTWSSDGRVMRCHPRLRDVLRGQLEQRDAVTVRTLRLRLAQWLVTTGHDEEALGELIALGRFDDAVAPAVRALPRVIARQDIELADGWLTAFEARGHLDHPELLAARLGVSMTLEHFGRAVAAADRLRAHEALAFGDAPALAAWAYWHVGRLEDARRVLDEAPPGHVAEHVRLLFSLVDAAPSREIPQPSGGPLDAALLRIAYVRGRLRDVRDAPVSEWMPAVTERIAAYRALGDLDRTREMLASAPGVLHNLRFEGTTRVELMMDLGDEEAAREALLRGRASIVRSGSFVFDIVSRLLAAKLELRMRRDATAALAILRGAEAAGPTRQYGYLAEQLDLWTGYGHLLRDEDDEALERLRAAVDSMRIADRILELPTAGVYLAEAEWRAGTPEAADAAADLALDAARRQGSRHLLLQAVADLPAVAARRLDAEEDVDGPWHDVGRGLGREQGRLMALGGAHVHLEDLGPPAIVVDGDRRRVRIGKTYALLAFLVHRGGIATRDEVFGALFDGRSDASTRAYLRQAVHGLRQALPEGPEVLVEETAIVLSDPRSVETQSQLVASRIASTSRLTGMRRYEALRRALEPLVAGEYLAGIDTAWVAERRAELSALANVTRIEMAVAAYEEARYDLAEPALLQVLEDDPHRERAWRLLMRIAGARGAQDEVIALYRRCEESLRVIGLAPAESTRLLAAGLRR